MNISSHINHVIISVHSLIKEKYGFNIRFDYLNDDRVPVWSTIADDVFAKINEQLSY